MPPPEKPPKARLTDNSTVLAEGGVGVVLVLELPEPPQATKTIAANGANASKAALRLKR